jgi:hypothetical protein
MDRAIYERTMRHLRVAVRVLSSLLLALIARMVMDGPTVAGGIGEVAMLLLLLASVALWRHIRRQSPGGEPLRTRWQAKHESAR